MNKSQPAEPEGNRKLTFESKKDMGLVEVSLVAREIRLLVI